MLRILITITTFMTSRKLSNCLYNKLVGAIIKRYAIMWNYLKLKASVDIRSIIFFSLIEHSMLAKARKSNHFWLCFIEVIYVLIHAPPNVDFMLTWSEQGVKIHYPYKSISRLRL